MKKSVLSFVIISTISVFALKAQDCVCYSPTNVGAKLEITNYDAQGVVTGSSLQTLIKKEITGNETRITFSSQRIKTNPEKDSVSTYDYYCKAGVFYVDMNKIVEPFKANLNNSMELTFSAIDLQIPGNLKVGDELPKSSVIITITSGKLPIMKYSISMVNRKVAAIETITTSAGSFECYKITYDNKSSMKFEVLHKCADWFAVNVGIIKSETYDEKGVLLNYFLLTKFSN
ncbi:MAG: hypothetical protein WCQ95_01560 [Bacteroidota bacterium]